jgi:hypothetical protein
MTDTEHGPLGPADVHTHVTATVGTLAVRHLPQNIEKEKIDIQRDRTA